ncbi:hypothetical protein MPSEU_000300000 [Mayamaea pseudoterrestris]|nr:hypothetical protein MPSEU_000300000 [Mayamaea pseudoterrestris]
MMETENLSSDSPPTVNSWQTMFDAFCATKTFDGRFEFSKEATVKGENLYRWLETQTFYDVPARTRKFEEVGFNLDTFENLTLLPSEAEGQSAINQDVAAEAISQAAEAISQTPVDNPVDSVAVEAENTSDSTNVITVQDVSDTGAVVQAPSEVNDGPKLYQLDATTGANIASFSSYKEAARQFEIEPNKVHNYSVEISRVAAGRRNVCRRGFVWKANTLLKQKSATFAASRTVFHRLNKTVPETKQGKHIPAGKKSQVDRWNSMFAQLKLIKTLVVGEFQLDKKSDLYRWILEQEHLYRLRETDAAEALSDEKLLRFRSIGLFMDKPPAEDESAVTTTEKLVDTLDLPLPAANSTTKVDCKEHDTVSTCHASAGPNAFAEPSLASQSFTSADNPSDMRMMEQHDVTTNVTQSEINTELDSTAIGGTTDEKVKVEQSLVAAPNTSDKKWETMFNLLSECKNEENNSFEIAGIKSSIIIRWISAQRRRYLNTVLNRVKGCSHSADLSQERIDRLMAIGLDLDPEGEAARVTKSAFLPIKMEVFKGEVVVEGATDPVSPAKVLSEDGLSKVSESSLLCGELSAAEPVTQSARPAVLNRLDSNQDLTTQSTNSLPNRDDVNNEKCTLGMCFPTLDASFWVLPESRQPFCCSFQNTKGCRSWGCKFIHIHYPWSNELMEEFWSECDKQLPANVKETYHENVSCLSIIANERKWYTARYSTESRMAHEKNRNVIFAAGGPTAHVSHQGVSWYPTEDDARSALEKAVIITFWAVSKGMPPSSLPSKIISEIVTLAAHRKERRRPSPDAKSYYGQTHSRSKGVNGSGASPETPQRFFMYESAEAMDQPSTCHSRSDAPHNQSMDLEPYQFKPYGTWSNYENGRQRLGHDMDSIHGAYSPMKRHKPSSYES